MLETIKPSKILNDFIHSKNPFSKYSTYKISAYVSCETVFPFNIKLTNKGLDLANLVWEEFV